MTQEQIQEIKSRVLAYEQLLKDCTYLSTARETLERYAYTDIKALLAEVEKLQQQNKTLANAIDDTMATLHYVEAERDKAIEDIRIVSDDTKPCVICLHNKPYDTYCVKCKHDDEGNDHHSIFKWRGLEIKE